MIAWSGFERGGPRSVTDRAVVVALWRVCETQERDRVLMLVVRKLGGELQLRSRITKRVTRIITRRGLRMTHRTDLRPRTAEKLRPVTTHARGVIGIIGDIREGYFVTRVASCFVFLC